MNRIVAMSIRSQLFLIALIVAVPAACIIIFSGINLRNEAMSEARIQTQKVADRIASDQHNLVVAAQQLLTALAQLPDVTSHNAVGIQPILSEILKLNSQYANIFIADSSGYVWAQGAQAKPVNVTDRRYFLNALASGQFSSGEYIISKAIKKPVLNFASPLKDKKGEFIGVIGVAFNLNYYGRTMETVEVPHGMNFLLVDHKGTVLFRSISAAQIAGNQDRPELFMHMQSKTEGDTFIDRGNDGVKRFMTFRKLSLKGEARPYMYIRVGIPVDIVLSEANMALMYSLILFTLFLMSAFFLSGLIGKRSIADRLALLKTASKRLADGDLQTRASDLVSGGELGELALAFDGMAEQIALREISLFEKTAEQETILQNAIVGVAFVKERMFSRVNRKMEQMFGYERNEMDGLSTELIYPSRDAFEQAGKTAYASLAEGKAYFLELTMKRKDGSCFWASLSGQAVDRSEMGKGSIWILQDMTKRKRAEEELHKSEERYRELVENANSIILRWDTQGNITFLNEYGLNFFGYTEAEIIGKNVIGTIVPKASQDGADLKRMIEGICLYPAAYEKNENENICKDGRRVFINWSNKPIHNISGEYIGILSVGNDVTYRRHIESQLQKSLTEKETLLRELYHRTKNNMQVITSLLNLQSRSIENKKTLQLFEDTKNRIHSMALVHEKLYKAKDLSQVGLKDYISDLSSHLLTSYQIDKDKISLLLDIANIPISIDTVTPLGLVINELMTNALKYAFPDNREGRITITAHLYTDNFIELSFSDNGIGFPVDINLNEPESLGLKIIRSLVEKQIKGQLQIQTDDETRFVIKFKEKENRQRI